MQSHETTATTATHVRSSKKLFCLSIDYFHPSTLTFFQTSKPTNFNKPTRLLLRFESNLLLKFFHILCTGHNSATMQETIFWETFSATIVNSHQLLFKISVQSDRERRKNLFRKCASPFSPCRSITFYLFPFGTFGHEYIDFRSYYWEFQATAVTELYGNQPQCFHLHRAFSYFFLLFESISGAWNRLNPNELDLTKKTHTQRHTPKQTATVLCSKHTPNVASSRLQLTLSKNLALNLPANPPNQ